MLNPRWKSSRRGVVEFALRAHNSVNARTGKKIYSFADSIAELGSFLPAEMASTRRQQYLVYIRNDWMRNMTIEGISTAGKLKELNMVEENYWSKRSFKWSDLDEYADVNVSPLVNATSTLASGQGGVFIPKIAMPAKGFTLRNIGKIGPLSSLRS